MPFTDKLADLVIPNGAAVSNIMDANGFYEDGIGLMIFAPAVLPETVVIQVTADLPPTVGGNWSVLQDDTPADIGAPAAGKARLYMRNIFANGFRLFSSSGNVAASRTFNVTKSAVEY